LKIAFMPDTHFGAYDQVQLPSGPEVADAMEHCLKESELAERCGFDGLWVPERHQRPETWWPNTVTQLAAIAARTSRVNIASTVIQPTFHHPVHLAEQLANIDCLSRGRLTFGAGVGYHQDYFRHFGVPYARRGARFEEVMEVIEACWTQETVNYQGEFFNYDGVKMSPKPYQQPRPPVWIGAFADKALERALRWDGWCLWFPPAVKDLKPQVEAMREKAYKLGKKNWQFTMGFEGWLDDDPEVRAKHGHRWVREWSFYAEKGLSPDAEAKDELSAIEDMFLCLGNRQKWIDRMGEIREQINPDWICFRTRNPVNLGKHYPSRQECLEVIERFGEILPLIR
jgi:probable F420-dependent oxidoreductase